MHVVANADRLYAVPLEDFVAERKRLAKELRDGGDREAAAEVAKLPKPTPPAWALNQLAREEPEAIGAWLDAAEELRDASAHPSSALREAMAGHREATRTLVAVVRDRARPGGKPLSEPMLERVRELLQAATVDPAVADALRAGRVVEGDEQPALPGFEAPAEPPPPRESAGERRAAAKAAKDREAERKAREQAERIAEPERLIAATEKRLASLTEEAEERESAAEEADARLEAAQQALHRAESEAAAARRAASDARDAAATSERELRQLQRQLRHHAS
jgi:hypothetical protein